MVYVSNYLKSNNLYDGATAYAITPKIGTIDADSYLYFSYKITAGNMLTTDTIWIEVSTDCGTTFETLAIIQEDAGVWQYASLSLSDYAETDVVIQFRAAKSGSGTFSFSIDDVGVDNGNDISVIGIVNDIDNFDPNLDNFDPTVPTPGVKRYVTCGEETNAVYAIIENQGRNAITDTVYLTVSVSGVYTATLDTIYTEDIAPGERVLVYLGTVNTVNPGLIDLVTTVTTDADNEPGNNELGFSITTQAVYAVPYEAFTGIYFNEGNFWKYDTYGNIGTGIFNINITGTHDLTTIPLVDGDTAVAISPRVGAVTANSYLVFDYTAINSIEAHIIYGEAIEVYVSTNCEDTWTLIRTIDVDENDESADGFEYLDISAFAGSDIRLKFQVVKGNSNGTFNVAFDDIKVIEHFPVTLEAEFEDDIYTEELTICEETGVGNIVLDAGLGYDFYAWYKIAFTDEGQPADIYLGALNTLTLTPTTGNTGTYYVNVQNDGVQTSDTIVITVNPFPLKAAIPQGDTEVCSNIGTNQYYTDGAVYATSYIWSINEAAGTIIGTGDTATVYWNEDFSGTAFIQVQGENDCGVGQASNTLTVVVNPSPSIPAVPTGNTVVCATSPNTSYTTTGGLNATSYIWTIIPGEAGSITGDGNIGTVDWDEDFGGTASISVRGVNDCGEGENSSAVFVTINPLPLMPPLPNNIDSVYCNRYASTFTTTGSSNATSYEWIIDPVNAGYPQGTGSTVTIVWNQMYFGELEMSLVAINDCGRSDTTESVTLTLDACLGIADNNLAGKFNVELYPNPTDGLMNLKFNGANNQMVELAIFTLEGKPLMITEVNMIETIELNLSGYEAGMYILRLRNDSYVLNKRIVLE